MTDAARLSEALDWFEQAIALLIERAQALGQADEERAVAAVRWQEVGKQLTTREARVLGTEAELAAREEAVRAREHAAESRERVLSEGAAAHADLTVQLEERTSAFEREARELAAAAERLRSQEQTADERAALLDRRAFELSERGAELDQLARDLGERAAAVAAQSRDLERFAERLRERDGELRRTERDLALVKRRVAEQELAAEHAAWVLRPVAVARQSGGWTLDELQRVVSSHGRANPARLDEWQTYLRYLRDFADVDGRLSSSFDRLIADVFAAPSAAIAD
jgi:uncharacterized protein (DUF3084 family)